MDIGKSITYCQIHHKKCQLVCLDKQCKIEQKILCTKCISQHYQHQIIEFDEVKQIVQQKEENIFKQLNEQQLQIWRHFSSSKQKINALLESIESKILSILCPQINLIRQYIQTNNINAFIKELNSVQQQNSLNQSSLVINLQNMQDKLFIALENLEELNRKYEWKQLKILEGHDDMIYSLDVSPDGTKCVTGSGDMHLRIWDLRNFTQIGQPIQAHEGIVWCVAYGQGCFVSGSDDNTIKFWSDKSHKIAEIKNTHDPVFSLTFNNDHTQLASGVNHLIIVWNIKARQQIVTLKGHTDYVTSLDYKGNYIVSGSKDKSVRLWNVQTKQQINIFQGNSLNVRSVAFSQDCKYIASGGYDKYIRIWNLNTKEMISYNHGDIIWVVKFYDKETLISGGKNGKINFWSVNETQQSELSIDCQKAIMALTINKYNNTIITGINKDVIIFEKENTNESIY